MRVKFILAFLCFAFYSQAATIERLGPGTWSDPTQWYIGGAVCGCTPSPGDDVIINTSNVVLNINATVTSVTVQAGNLVVSVGKILTLTGSTSPLIIDDQMQNNGIVKLLLPDSSSPAMIINGAFTNQNILDIGDNQSGRGIEVNGTLTNTGTIVVNKTASENIFIENIGSVDNDNIILLNGPSSGAALDIVGSFDNSGNVTIDSSSFYGVHKQVIGVWTHTGSIEVSHCSDAAVYIEGSFTNNGSINIKNTDSRGIEIDNSAYVNNNGSMHVSGPTIDEAVYNVGTLDNLGYITVDSSLTSGIYNAGIGIINNDNYVRVGGAIGDKGIWNIGTLINNDSILLTQSSVNAFQTQGTMTNNGLIDIYGMHTDGLRILSTLTNLGVINIKDAITHGLELSSAGILDNQNLITIDHNSTLGLYNSGSITNSACGIIDTKSKIYSSASASLDNQTYIYSDYSSSHTLFSTFVNNGIIEQKGVGFNSTSMTNDGFVIKEMTGTYCEGDIISGVFSGAGTNANFLAPVSSSEAHGDVVATFDAVSNELTLLPSCLGLTTLYFQFNQGSCIKSFALDFDEPLRAKWFADTDLDGYGDLSTFECDTIQPSGYVLDYSDCDDTDEYIYPGAPERCNGIDDDCDGNPESIVNVWTGTGDGISWSDGNNWSEGYEPLECQEVIIDVPGTIVTQLSGDSTKIAKLSINLTTITLIIEPGAEILVENKGIIAQGKIINDGSLKVYNSIANAIEIYDQLNNNGTLEIIHSNNYGIWIHSGYQLFNSGDINITGNILNSAIFNEGTLDNSTAGNIHVYAVPNSIKCLELLAGALAASVHNDGNIELENGGYGIYHGNSSSNLINGATGNIDISLMSYSGIANGTFDNSGYIEISDITEVALNNVNGSVNQAKILITDIDSTAIDIQGTFTNIDSVVIMNAIDGITIDGTEYDNQGITLINMSLADGLQIQPGARLFNNGELTITNSTANGITSLGDIDNFAQINIIGAGNRGIESGIGFLNEVAGNISIEGTANTGLDMNTSSFLNKNIITFKNIGTDAFDLDNASGAVNFGTINFQSGIVDSSLIGSSVLINEMSGLIEGEGIIDANVLNNLGTLSPGPVSESFHMDGPYNHINGTYIVDLEGYSGPGVANGNDIITSNDPLMLGGTLNLNLAGGFEPVPGDEFYIIDAGSRVGNFTTINLPINYCMVVEYTPNHVKITMPGLATGTWTGMVSKDWFDYQNWAEGCVPGPNTDVSINLSLNTPEIGFNKIARIKSLIANPLTNLKVITGSGLEIKN